MIDRNGKNANFEASFVKKIAGKSISISKSWQKRKEVIGKAFKVYNYKNVITGKKIQTKGLNLWQRMKVNY